MRPSFSIGKGGGSLILIKERGDRHIYGDRHAQGEHLLLYKAKLLLNRLGFSLIKKRAQLDGHMIGDQFQPYLRPRNERSEAPHIYIFNGCYALYGANREWNKQGKVRLEVHGNAFGTQPDWHERLLLLSQKHGFEAIRN